MATTSSDWNCVLNKLLRYTLAIFAALAVFAAKADSVEFQGVTLEYSGAEVLWPTGGDIVFVYTNSVGNLILPGSAVGRILAVGGGGAGSATSDDERKAQNIGGGGGAGGKFVAKDGFAFNGGTYSVVLGAGGTDAGAAGGESSVKLGDTEICVAAGGEGGNVFGNGGDGGLSGTGSQPRSQDILVFGGEGGRGEASDITGEELYYAAGGGGAVLVGNNRGLGGSGVGGNGAFGAGGQIPATDGVRGSGGGGGSSVDTYGKGGDGVVIIRLSAVASEPLVRPSKLQPKDGYYYNGEKQNAIKPSTGYAISGDIDKTFVSSFPYVTTATLKPGFKWTDGTDTEDTVEWTIKKAKNRIDDLALKGWKIDESANEPTCKPLWGGAFKVVYTYADAVDAENWSLKAPESAGLWYVKATLLEDDNWEGAEAIADFYLWDDSTTTDFTDFVEITLDYSEEQVANAVVTIELSENSPVGFTYSRANDGFFFLADGQMLDYEIVAWNPFGVSTIKVKVPLLVDKTKISMYWHPESGVAPPQRTIEGSVVETEKEFSLVSRNGKFVNYFTSAPTISPVQWEAIDPPDALTIEPGELADGAEVTHYFYYATRPDVRIETYEELKAQGLAGIYRAVFVPVEADKYEEVKYEIDLRVIGHTEYTTLGELAEGRILLANNDCREGTRANPAVNYQGWYDADNAGAKKQTPIYWHHDNPDEAIALYNLKPSANSTMWAKTEDGGRRLWVLENCRQGNTFPRDNDTAPLAIDQNYLPYDAENSLRIGEHSTRAVRRRDVGQIVMRNVLGASITSPCYTNGVGTVYFDAVNGWTTPKFNGESVYKFVVEIAKGDVTDDFLDWEAVVPRVIRFSNGSTTELEPSEEIVLEETLGGSMENFYRIFLPLNEYGPVRFRVRRTAVHPDFDDPDARALILFDNFIVSYPAMSVDLTPGDGFDPERRDKAIVGFEGATEPRYPSATDEIFAKATPIYHTAGGVEADERAFVSAATIHYRWRYLGQSIGEWKKAYLDPMNGFKSLTALELPGDVGDVEFYYDADIQAPYYGYVDYTGLDRGVPNYTEEVSALTNRAEVAENVYPTMGTDWFVRLRYGKSSYREVKVLTKTAEDAEVVTTNLMEVVSDGTWRGAVETPQALKDGLYYRLEGVNDVEFKFWRGASEIDDLPMETALEECAGDDWAKAKCDAATGYLVFRFDEIASSLTVARADFQDFNTWTSAVDTDGLYVGNSVDTNTTTYVTKETDADILSWPESISTNDHWRESFDAPGQPSHIVYPRDEPFTDAVRTRKGWTAENGLWTYGKWSLQSNTGIGDDTALQLEGRGKGRFSFIDAVDTPDGLDAVVFKARPAQFNEFENFSYYNDIIFITKPGGGTEAEFSTMMTNYNFVAMGALTENGAASYDGDGSLSMVGYYDPQNGAYEFRVSRGKTDTDGRMALYRWRNDGYSMVCELLGSYDFANVASRLVRDGKSQLAGLFLSIEEYRDEQGHLGTLINAGVADADISMSSTINALSGQKYNSVVYFDTSDKRLKRGTFGTLMRNSPAVLVKPTYYDQGSGFFGGNVKADEFNHYSVGQTTARNFSGIYNHDGISDYSNWVVKPGRIEALADHPSCHGFQAIRDISQKIAVQISRHGASDWQTVATNTVSGYTYQSFTNFVRRAETCDVRLQTVNEGGPRIDIAVDDIELTQWAGMWTDGYDLIESRGLPDEFVYTASWIKRVYDDQSLLLQPARAKSDAEPVSLRSPIMNGFGVFHFRWRNADPNAKLLLQIDRSATSNNLIARTEAAADNANWETIETFDFANMAMSGSTNCYPNLRYPIKGAMRLIVDREIEKAAIDAARTDPDFGSVEIVEAFVQDLPEYDSHSWSGWNFRTAGWTDGLRGDEFANLVDATRGLSGLLNNTLNIGTLYDKKVEYYSEHAPSVVSPTFTTNCIGALEFRARLYNIKDVEAYGHPAAVTVFGATEIDDKGEPLVWKEIGDVIVDKAFYAPYSLKFPANSKYYAIRLGVKGVEGVRQGGEPVYNPPLRVALDDICIWEKPQLSIAFSALRTRPFRNAEAIANTLKVEDIDSFNEQPIIGESFGFQTEIVLKRSEDILLDDPKHPIKVQLWCYPAVEPWGFENWKDRVRPVELVVADGEKLVFRSTMANTDTMCSPQFLGKDETHRFVQYHLTATYYDKSFDLYTHELSASDWATPSWYAGIADPNAKSASAFSAYTILETVAPKRAWINEVNLAEADRDASKVDQWVEIAVPSGVDMTGWKLKLYDYDGNSLGNLMTFGRNGAPASKQSAGSTNHYDFYVVKNPSSTLLADATWANFTQGMVEKGVLSHTYPYGFELVRPSGVVEHQVVIQGYNQFKALGWASAYRYEGTNLVAVLSRERGGDWVWGEEDMHLEPGCTVGVTANQGGKHEEWFSPMGRTPGEINDNQYINPNWFVTPNGGYFWVYASTIGEHIRQIIGGETNTVATLTIKSGDTTNIVYEVDRWYELGEVSVTPDPYLPSAPETREGKRYYTLELKGVTNRLDVVAHDAIDAKIAEALHLDKGNRYRDAVMKWLEDNNENFVGDEIIPGEYRGTKGVLHWPIDLTGMYWLDLDPTRGGWELWGGMGEKDGTQALGPVNEPIIRTKIVDGVLQWTHTNRLTTVWMMITNKNDEAFAAYPPYRLQGLGNERSDEYAGAWTSVTFKVMMRLLGGGEEGKLRPMRQFVFGPDSFRPADDPVAPFSARIEVTDPFSWESPAWEWGWWKYSHLNPVTSWKISTDINPAGVTTLKKDDVFGPVE